PRLLKQAGYRTASIGKIHLVPQRAEPDAIQQALDTTGDYFGFSEIDLVNGHGDHCFGPQYDAWLQERVPDWQERLKDRRRISPGLDTFTWELPPEVHSSNYIGDKTVEFLQNVGD